MQGLVEKMQLNLWDGFHEVLIDMATKLVEGGTDRSERKVAEKCLLALPFYMLTMTGKIDVKLDQSSFAELLKLPQAEVAKLNVH